MGEIDMKIGPFSTTSWVRGSRLTYDATAMAGYLTVCPDPEQNELLGTPKTGCHHRSGGTVEVEPGRLNVDVDDKGRVLGIESLHGPVGMGDVVLVFRWLLREGDDTDAEGAE